MTSLTLPLLRKKSLQIDIQKILYLESAGVVCYLKSIESGNDQGIPINSTLNRVEKLLDSRSLFRIHRGFIVNLQHVVEYGDYPKSYIELITGEQLPLSKRRKLTFHNAYLYFKKDQEC